MSIGRRMAVMDRAYLRYRAQAYAELDGVFANSAGPGQGECISCEKIRALGGMAVVLDAHTGLAWCKPCWAWATEFDPGAPCPTCGCVSH